MKFSVNRTRLPSHLGLGWGEEDFCIKQDLQAFNLQFMARVKIPIIEPNILLSAQTTDWQSELVYYRALLLLAQWS